MARNVQADSERDTGQSDRGAGDAPQAQRRFLRLLATEPCSMNDHAISRLIAKRAEIAGMVAELEEELNQCRADLTHIDGALRLLSVDLDPETIQPRPRRYKQTHYFGRNELSRLCMEMLRLTDGEPLTSEEITLRIMTAKGLDARDA